MAIARCVKCNGTSFGTQEISPTGSNFKMIAIACNSCGGAIGVMDYFNIGAKINELEQMIKGLVGITNALRHDVDAIAQRVARLR